MQLFWLFDIIAIIEIIANIVVVTSTLISVPGPIQAVGGSLLLCPNLESIILPPRPSNSYTKQGKGSEKLTQMCVLPIRDICCCSFPSFSTTCSRMRWPNTTEPSPAEQLFLWTRRVKLSRSPTPSSCGTKCIVAPLQRWLRPKCNKMSTLCWPWETGAVSNSNKTLALL